MGCDRVRDIDPLVRESARLKNPDDGSRYDCEDGMIVTLFRSSATTLNHKIDG